MFSYAEVERILVELHVQPQSRLAAFRARLKYLQRLGVPTGERPGRGKRIEYTREQLYQLALALEFSQFGIDPNTCAVMIKHDWRKLYRLTFQRAEKEGGQLFILFTPEFIPWQTAADVLATYHLRCVTRDQVLEEIDRTTDKAGKDTRRKSFLNLTDLLKRINELAEGAER